MFIFLYCQLRKLFTAEWGNVCGRQVLCCGVSLWLNCWQSVLGGWKPWKKPASLTLAIKHPLQHQTDFHYISSWGFLRASLLVELWKRKRKKKRILWVLSHNDQEADWWHDWKRLLRWKLVNNGRTRSNGGDLTAVQDHPSTLESVSIFRLQSKKKKKLTLLPQNTHWGQWQ